MTTDTLPLGRMLAIFLGLLILANVILGAVGFFFPDLPIPSSMGIVVAMIAAMSSGQAAPRRWVAGLYSAKRPSSRCWPPLFPWRWAWPSSGRC